MLSKLTTNTRALISPLIDKKKRKIAIKQARGIWKYKKSKIAKEYRAMRKEWD